ncbi:MAG: LPS-assembly protein LptD [Paludibacteraceae bacterium]|nr:LPS-assembly protein LptD [Paludibacteraceae bacterium]
MEAGKSVASQVHSTPAQAHAAATSTATQTRATAAKDTPVETRATAASTAIQTHATATSTATQTRATAKDTPEQKEDTLAQKWASRTQRADTLIQGTDSLTQGTDSLTQGTDSLAQAAPQKAKKSAISAPIHYQASDSMVMMANGTAYLHGKGDLKYEQMQLTSDYIRMNIDSSQIFAHGVWDSINEEWHGKPVFKDGKDEYETNEITYNIKTQKGYIRHVVTQQGEGYIIADRTKKAEGDVMMMAGGQYTTCDDHEHPHFYLKMTKAKVKPGEYIATGPAYMVVGDVPLPLAIPFGFFPFTNKYSSGLIMPNFGDDYTRGLYLSNLGYYFAICDYLDLQITGDIYTRGTWAIRAQSKYIWRYHFSGNLNISYRNDVTSEKGMPDYAVKKNFQVQWTHTQDAKFNPYSSFSASVNFATSGYNRSNINSYYNPNLYSENTKSSTINFTQRFPDSPWTLSASASLTQRTSDSTISLTAPQLSISMSSIYPFKLARQNALKRKGKVGDGKERWYEKIKMSYTMNGQISISAIKEKDFLKSNFLRDWQVGLSHSLPINASFMLFKYLSVTPSINLRDKMYFTRIDRSWDEASQMMAMDTTTGFYNVFDFDVGVSLQTKIYGFYTPLKRLFPNSRVEKFRHVITPRVSFSYHPDFGKAGWGYYGSYDEPVYYKDSVDGAGMKVPTGEVIHRTYSRFSGANAPRGMAATLNFGVENNLEMKVVNRDDTTGKAPYKVVSLIDNLGISGGYNFAADSMNWSNFQVNLRLKFPKLNNYSLNMSTYLDPYMYQLDATGQPIRTNKQYWHNGRFPHWSGFSWNFSYTISNQTIKKWKEQIAAKQEGRRARTEETADSEITPVERNEDGTDKNAKINNNGKKKESEVDDGYVKTDFPWSISINYSLAYAAGSEFDYERMYPKMKWRNSLSLSGNIGLGQGWKVSANMTYNFDVMKLTSCTFNISRDLHCWNMSASINPIGPFKSYTFHIGVNASILSDLKYDKSSNQSTNGRVNWW